LQGDRIIVFCQFDDLKNKVGEAFKDSKIEALQLNGPVSRQIKTVSIFQKENPDKKDARVLLLKMDDEQSAGLNLTNLNHAIFVHPLLAGSQQEYDAYETQAIGRIRRFGQNKTVHVWRFLAKKTIDTAIFDKYSGRAISATTINSAAGMMERD
jgi:SNF2 family DNA or RNA helicase